MPYEERQKNHASYYFACTCTLCLRDVATAWPILQCRQCPGPVLSNASVYDPNKEDKKEALCLFCCQPYPGTARALEALTVAHFELDGMIKLLEIVEDEEKDKFLVKIGQQFNTIKGLIYRKSITLKEDIVKMTKAYSKALSKQVWAEEIDQLCQLADQITQDEKEASGNNEIKENFTPKENKLYHCSEQLAEIENLLKTFNFEA